MADEMMGHMDDKDSVSEGSEKAAGMGSCEGMAGCQMDAESLSEGKENASSKDMSGMAGSMMESGS